MITDNQKWLTILQKQGRLNAERWLKLATENKHSPDFVSKEYDNLLRALEYTLNEPVNFDLAYALIQILYNSAFGYADWDRWLVYLQKALTRSRTLNQAEEEAGLLDLIGGVYQHQGNLNLSEVSFKAALSIYEQVDQKPKQAIMLAKLAHIYDDRGGDGLTLCLEALAIAESTQDNLAIAISQLNLSLIYMRMRNWQAALPAAENAHLLYQKLNEPTLSTRAFFNIISCRGELGQWNELREAASQLTKELTTKGDIHTLAKLQNNLGLTAFNQGMLEEAEENWQEALKLQSLLQNRAEQAFLYNNLGMLYTKLGEPETAEEMLKQAIAIQHTLGDVYNWANAIDNLADLYDLIG